MGEKKKKRKKRKKKPLAFKIIMSLLVILLVLITIGLSSIYSILGKIDTVKIHSENLGINHDEISTYQNIENIKNIALFGIDSNADSTGRSDAVLILTIDNNNNKLKLTSIMRDSYVNIPNHGMDKLNHAYAFGGAELAIQTLNNNFGLNIEDFVSVNFSSLPQIINLLGGVQINITEEEVNHIPTITAPGLYNLTGEEALYYSMIRYASGGDYVRTDRQRTVLNCLFSKLSQVPISSYPQILSEVLPYLKTSMSSTEILSLSSKATSVISNGLIQSRFPKDDYSEGNMIDGIYYLTFNIEDTKKQIMDYIYNDK